MTLLERITWIKEHMANPKLLVTGKEFNQSLADKKRSRTSLQQQLEDSAAHPQKHHGRHRGEA